MGLLGWVRSIGGVSKEQITIAQLKELIEHKLIGLEREYKEVLKIHNRAPIYFIKKGGWAVTLSNEELYITYTVGKGILKIKVTPSFSGNKLTSLRFSHSNEKISNDLKDCYLKPVADALAAHFGKTVKIIY